MRVASLSTLLLLCACRIDALQVSGRPCGAAEPCGPGAICVGGRCVGGADLARGDGPLALDGPRVEQALDASALDLRPAERRGDLLPDQKQPLDKLPPDTLLPDKPLADTRPPDQGKADGGSGCVGCTLGCDAALNRCSACCPPTSTRSPSSLR
jgi:hypothetical protein